MISPTIHYSMLIEWSEEKQAYLVTLPKWVSQIYIPATHGKYLRRSRKEWERSSCIAC